MASATQIFSRADQSGVQAPLSPGKCQARFELGVALVLNLWPALTLAVQNSWGGPTSSDKRDWFAGAIVELFESRPETDLEDVETVLLQVMLDEFEVNVDDDSALEVAEQIVQLRRDVGKGDFTEVDRMRERWENRGGKEIKFQRVERGEDEDDTDWDSDDLETDEDEDIEMGDAPSAREKEKPALEVDKDGFTKVVSRKKR